MKKPLSQVIPRRKNLWVSFGNPSTLAPSAKARKPNDEITGVAVTWSEKKRGLLESLEMEKRGEKVQRLLFFLFLAWASTCCCYSRYLLFTNVLLTCFFLCVVFCCSPLDAFGAPFLVEMFAKAGKQAKLYLVFFGVALFRQEYDMVPKSRSGFRDDVPGGWFFQALFWLVASAGEEDNESRLFK